MKRRGFLRSVGVLSGGFAAGAARLTAQGATAFRFPAQDDPGYWNAVRSQFPFAPGFAYLNTAGLGSSPRPVSDVVKTWMDREDANPAPGHSEEDFRRIRATCAGLLGPSCSGDELAFLSTATEAINAILDTFRWAAGDEVITSTHEHASLAIALLHRANTRGIVIRTFEPDVDSTAGNVARIERLVSPRTRLIFVSHVTCTTGQVMSPEAIGAIAAKHGLAFALDGAQSWAHVPCDLGRSGAHFYAASGHKWILGPKRTGILWIRKDRIVDAMPSVVGAYSDASSSLAERRLVLQPTAQRFEYGTQNDALIYGLEAGAQFINAIGLDRAWAYDRSLAERFVEGLRQVRGARLLSPRERADRTAIISFALEGRDNRQVAAELGRRRLRVRSVTEGGLDAVRASFHVCNDVSEVDRLLAALGSL